MWTVGLAQAKDNECIRPFHNCLLYCLLIWGYLLNIMRPAQTQMIVKKKEQKSEYSFSAQFLIVPYYLTLSKLSCKEAASFALCSVVAYSLTLLMGNEVPFMRF